MKIVRLILLSLLLFSYSNAFSWGFLAHRNINRYAVYILPEPMIGFYKNHIEYLSEHAIDPDKRSQVSHDEAVKHYIDIDIYGDNPFEIMPKEWKDATAMFTEDTLKEYGILPWNVEWVFGNLVNAFKSKDVDRILYISASLGHYIADATVPLHTSQYYDGKEMRQKGIHAFWETRMVELFLEDWDFFVGKAEYIKDPLGKAWELVEQSHAEVDTVFDAEINLRTLFPEDKKFVIDQKYSGNKPQISKEYGISFNAYTKFMVERQFKIAIKMVASFWYSAWVNAGQPDLDGLENVDISAKHQAELDEIDQKFQDAYNGEEHIY
jgi:hypothetical protein